MSMLLEPAAGAGNLSADDVFALDLFRLEADERAIELSIIMPCLNEAETLAGCIEKAKTFLDRSGTSGEIIVADNGSTDGSREIARAHGARVIAIAMRGYGAALFGAMFAARGRYCIMGDSDGSYDFSALDVFLDKLRDGHDLVMGNRFEGGIAPGAMPWKNRYIGNPVLSGIGRLFFVSPVRDFHCGLRGLSKAAFERMDLRTTGMEYASEMVIKATLLKMRIAEVPTTLSVDGRSRPPHLRPYRDGWRHLRFMLLFSPDWLFLYPGLALMAAGMLTGGVLLMGPVRIADVRFSLDTLLYCSAMIGIGFQAILFAILSRNFAIQEQLVPRPPGRRFILDAITLERGLLLGAGILSVGVIAALRAILLWRGARFGELDVEQISRIVIASSLALSLGAETIFSSFLLSILKLNKRSYPASARASRPE